jgi:hypothetical protein
VALGGGRTAIVTLRKGPHGELLTQAVPSRGPRLNDEQALLVSRAEAQLREEAGQ